MNCFNKVFFFVWITNLNFTFCPEMRKGLGYRLWMGAVNQLTKKFSVNQLDKYLCCCKEATRCFVSVSNRRLCYRRIKGNYWQTRSIAWPLCNSRARLLIQINYRCVSFRCFRLSDLRDERRDLRLIYWALCDKPAVSTNNGSDQSNSVWRQLWKQDAYCCQRF